MKIIKVKNLNQFTVRQRQKYNQKQHLIIIIKEKKIEIKGQQKENFSSKLQNKQTCRSFIDKEKTYLKQNERTIMNRQNTLIYK